MSLRMVIGHRLALIVVAVLLSTLLIAGCAPSALEIDETPATAQPAPTFDLFGQEFPAAADGGHVFVLQPESATRRDGAMRWVLVLADDASGAGAAVTIYSRREPGAPSTWRVTVAPARSGAATGRRTVSVTPSHVSGATDRIVAQTAPLPGLAGAHQYLLVIEGDGLAAGRFVMATVRLGDTT